MANEELEISSTSNDGNPQQRRGGKSRSIFNRLKLRSRSVANMRSTTSTTTTPEKQQPSNGGSRGGSYFSSWFTRSKPSASPQASSIETPTTTTKEITTKRGEDKDAEKEQHEEEEGKIESSKLNGIVTVANGGLKTTTTPTSCSFKKNPSNNIITNYNGLTTATTQSSVKNIRQLSASHSNLHSTTFHHHSEMLNGRKADDVRSITAAELALNDSGTTTISSSTSKMPSYVNISLMANGYSRSRTNLHSILNRSGDIHNLIVDGTNVTDLNPEHKSVIFVGEKNATTTTTATMKKLPSPSTAALNFNLFSFIIPEFKVSNESIQTFQKLTENLQNILSKFIENSENILSSSTTRMENISDEAKEAILVASGHTRVLLKSKVKKMFQLIEKHSETKGEKVTLNDLASFWEMMDIDVAKIREQFEIVEKFRLNHWKPFPEEEITPREFISPLSTPRATPSKPRTTTKIISSKVETPRTTSTTAVNSTNSAAATPRAARPNVKDFLAAKRKELAKKEVVENGINGHNNGVEVTNNGHNGTTTADIKNVHQNNGNDIAASLVKTQ